MEKKEKNFCPLCGKSRDEPLTRVALTMIEEFEEMVLVDCCKLCEVVLYNIRRIYVEKQEECLKKRREMGQSIIKVVSR